MTTAQHHQRRSFPFDAQGLLDPIIRRELAGIDIKPGHRILEIGAGTGEITAHLARLVDQTGTVSVVDKDTSYLNPTPIIDVYQRQFDADVLPGEPDSYHLVVARWLHGELADPAGVLGQIVTRLRPDGWLVLADVTNTPPRVFRAAADSDATLIRTVMRHIYRMIAGPDGAGTWAIDTPALLIDKGIAQVCTHTGTETWTGGGPGCRLLADMADRLRPLLATPEVTDADLDRFVTLMADPDVLLGSYERRTIHARKAN